jgi:hypothetical protein
VGYRGELERGGTVLRGPFFAQVATFGLATTSARPFALLLRKK